MPKLEFTAGKFEISCWTESHPMWMTLKYDGEAMKTRFDHRELRDLSHVIDRMLKQGRAALPPNCRHEMD